MNNFIRVIHCLFPLIALLLLIWGIRKKAIYYIISSLWLSIIALVIHYQLSGGQILGSYFNYINAAMYSINLIVLVLALIYIISHLTNSSKINKYLTSFIQSVLVIVSLLVVVNLGFNAYFIENKMEGTPIMQVALFTKPTYCSYHYIFYKVNPEGTISYLCPNHYGLIPSMGTLQIGPDFITTQLSIPNKKKMLDSQKKKLSLLHEINTFAQDI